MSLFLSLKNVFDYLLAKSISTQKEQYLSKVELKIAKNFNLLLTLQDGRRLLVKQERHAQEGKTVGEFLNEWRIQEFVVKTPELSKIRPMLSEVLHFDANHCIIVFNYLNDYCDLADFYTKENAFSTAITTSIGTTLSTIHRATFNRQEYQGFFSENLENVPIDQTPKFAHGLERISPEVFGQVPADGLKFFALYQRYDSLGKAIAELATAFEPCCLTHNDLKLNNILLHNDWEQVISKAEQSSHSIIRLIDWERGAWGDPAFDLGMLIASYLQIWLSSLVVSKSIDIEESLRLAMTPLEVLQPSIAALTKAYFGNFPEIIERRPDFLRRVVQFSGLALIQQIQAMLQYQKSFGNTGICMLQVAKTLLCRPEQSIPTVFGMAESELTDLTSRLWHNLAYHCYSCAEWRLYPLPRLAPSALQLSEADRQELQQLVNRHSTPQQIALRARIILLADQGQNHRQIARKLDISRDMARHWRHRWLTLAERAMPVCERLQDAFRSGAPAKFDMEQVIKLFAIACDKPEHYDRPISHWTAQELASVMVKLGIVESISPRHVGRLRRSCRPQTPPESILVDPPRMRTLTTK